MRPTVVAVVAVAGLLLTACGGSSGSDILTGKGTTSDPYAGLMHVKSSNADDATPLERAGAAGRALECDGTPYAGGSGDYSDGLESAQNSAAKALADWLEEEGAALPHDGYRVERQHDNRVLFSYDVRGRTKVAVIAADGTKDFDGKVGWGVESFGECDPAELPGSVTNDLDVDVWSDASSRRVPVTTIQSFQGAEHCDWEDITFLVLGTGGEDETFVRDTDHQLDELLETTYASPVAVPAGATDTGFHRDGRELWLSPQHDAAYLVNRHDATDVERWPAAKQRIGCA